MVSYFCHPLAAQRPPSNSPVLPRAAAPARAAMPCRSRTSHRRGVSLVSRTPPGCTEQAGPAAVTFLTSGGNTQPVDRPGGGTGGGIGSG